MNSIYKSGIQNTKQTQTSPSLPPHPTSKGWKEGIHNCDSLLQGPDIPTGPQMGVSTKFCHQQAFNSMQDLPWLPVHSNIKDHA